MIWNVFWLLSVAILSLSIAVAIIAIIKKNAKVKPLYYLFAGVFASSVLLIFPIYKISFEGDIGSTFKAIIISLQNTIQFFTADSDFALVNENVAHLSGWIKEAYNLLGAVLIIVAPVLTFGFVLSFFKGATAQLKHLFHIPADTFVFSEINEKTVALAESIRCKNKHDIIVFSNVPKEEDTIDDDLFTRVRLTGGILYKKDISLVKIPWIRYVKQVSFFAMCNEESESINETLQLIHRYKKRNNIRIYLFSHSVESELMLNNIDKGNIKIRRVNPIHSLVNNFLINDGKVLFESAADTENGEKEISALIVGAGMLGKELLKALSWYCQMDNYYLRINAFDKEENIKDQVFAMCPELIDSRYNGKKQDGEAYYNINISTADVTTETFRQEIRDIGNITCVFVSLGNDSLNIQTAVNLRILFEQLHISPQIFAFVSETERKEALSGAKDRNGISYNIQFVGDAKSIYSSDVILNSTTELAALELHKRYNNGDPYGFYEFEYNYKSSMASVIHYAARIDCKIPGAGVSESKLTDEEKKIIETLEHKRWNAYMRSEGYIYSGSKERESRNDMGKMHNNLVVFDELTDEDKRKDSRVGAK